MYEELGAEEYYLLDPEDKFLPSPLLAYQRDGENLVEVTTTNERILSPRIGLEIVWDADTFRFFNPQTNEYLRTLEESEREVERLKAEIEKLKAESK